MGFLLSLAFLSFPRGGLWAVGGVGIDKKFVLFVTNHAVPEWDGVNDTLVRELRC